MSKLTLIRGLPGSGKTTLAKTMTHAYHVETDMYFMVNGEYKFDPKQLGPAHDWCQRQAALFLESGKDVVVSNTFTRRWEIEPYEKMAKVLGCGFEVLETNGVYQNVHGVPPEAIERMKARWETYEPQTSC
jgi:predicted kinase